MYYCFAVSSLQNIVFILTSMLAPQNLTENFPCNPNTLVKETYKLSGRNACSKLPPFSQVIGLGCFYIFYFYICNFPDSSGTCFPHLTIFYPSLAGLKSPPRCSRAQHQNDSPSQSLFPATRRKKKNQDMSFDN